jgi:hypothetical protein
MKNNEKINTFKNIFIYLTQILISIIFFVIVLHIDIPQDIGKFLNNNFFMLIISIIAFYLCTQVKKAKTFISLLVLLLLFAIPLSYYWTTGVSTQKIVGGLIPHRDSMYYYLDARNVLNGKLINSMTSARPIFSGFLAFLITLTKNNIQTTLMILASLCAISFYFLFDEAQVEFGPLPASILMAGVYSFYARFIPHLVSEQLGMILSLTGLTLLLFGIRRISKKFLFLGILMVTLALNTRSGAMFVLPALVVFSGFAFNKKRFSFTDFGWAAAAVLLGFLINYLVFQLLVDPGKMPYSSFAFAIYGQSKGGAGWTSHQKDFPGLTNTYEILNLALMNIKRYPLGLVIGSLKAFRDFFLPGIDNAFVFITGYGNSFIVYLLWAVTWFFTGYEFVHSFRNIKNPFQQFELLVFAGIILSVPFAPPRDSSSMRTYAATIPFLMLLPVAGIAHLLDKTDLKKYFKINKAHISCPTSMLVYSIILISIITLTPIIIKFFVKPVSYLNNECTTEQTPTVFQLNQGSYITLIPDGSAPCAGTPDICFSKFISNVSVGVKELYDAVLETTQTSKESVIFSAVNDLNTGKYYYVLLDQEKLPDINADLQTISACLTEIDHREFLFSATYINDAEIIINQ